MQAESFEIQAKIRIKCSDPVMDGLKKPGIEILRFRHYRQFDTYFTFEDPGQGHLRYREDQFINDKGEPESVRSRLTLIGVVSEHRFPQRVLLSRSRYLAPATQSLRFYREYFKPSSALEIEKDRLRYTIRYKDTEFYVNIDSIQKPSLGCFLEIKSSTWSLKDAEVKSALVRELITMLGAESAETITEDYFELARYA
jgi:5-methylthioadenosine/S-adenosylhomocysteine deaminase